MDERDLIRVGVVVAKAIALALVYALPAILAVWWRQGRQERIALLNLLLGWTGVGWLILLVYVVARRLRNSRSPSWRNRSRGRAETEQQRGRQSASAGSLRAEFDGAASLR